MALALDAKYSVASRISTAYLHRKNASGGGHHKPMEVVMILRDSYGWPVELVIGRPVLNAFRRVLVTNWRVTWKRRSDGWPISAPDLNVCGSAPAEERNMAKTGVCVWVEIPPGNVFSSAFPAGYYIGCNQERCAGMLNGRPYSYCPFCGKEIESVDPQSDAEAKRG